MQDGASAVSGVRAVAWSAVTQPGGNDGDAGIAALPRAGWARQASRIRDNVVVGLPGFDGLPRRRHPVVRSGIGIGEDRVCLRVRIVAPGLHFIGGEGTRAALDSAVVAVVIGLRGHRTDRTDRWGGGDSKRIRARGRIGLGADGRERGYAQRLRAVTEDLVPVVGCRPYESAARLQRGCHGGSGSGAKLPVRSRAGAA